MIFCSPTNCIGWTNVNKLVKPLDPVSVNVLFTERDVSHLHTHAYFWSTPSSIQVGKKVHYMIVSYIILMTWQSASWIFCIITNHITLFGLLADTCKKGNGQIRSSIHLGLPHVCTVKKDNISKNRFSVVKVSHGRCLTYCSIAGNVHPKCYIYEFGGKLSKHITYNCIDLGWPKMKRSPLAAPIKREIWCIQMLTL